MIINKLIICAHTHTHTHTHSYFNPYSVISHRKFTFLSLRKASFYSHIVYYDTISN